jgi:hypothetical protein
MEKARFGSVHGPLVSPEEFHIRATPQYKLRGIFPYCDSCHELVHLYGVHTPNPATIPRFDHQDLPPDADPLDDCILANRNARFRGLEPDGYDDARGQSIRSRFFDTEFLAQAYVFCLSLCRQGNLPAAKFRSMLRRADKKRIWSYVDIQVWSIPYILLTLENFSSKTKDGREYAFHFTFQKPRGTKVSALWTRQQECRLVKVFSKSGEPIQADDNPLWVSEQTFQDKSTNTSWITPDFLRALGS